MIVGGPRAKETNGVEQGFHAKSQTYLFHHASRLELVAVRQAPDEAPFALPVDPQPRSLPARAAERLALRLGAVRHAGLIAWVGIVARAPMARATFLRLAVEEEISEYPAGTPKETVRPALDAALVLVKDENGAGGDHLAFRVDEAPGDARNHSTACGLEDEESITGGFNPA